MRPRSNPSNAAMAIIQTPRLVLRPPIGSDIEPMMVIHQDPDVMKYLDSHVSGDIGVAWRNVAIMIGHWSISGFGPWTIMLKESSQIIGRAGLWYPAGAANVELGWMIRRSDWGRGFATEAASAALEWAWQHVDTEHIVSTISAANTPSIRIAEKLGQRLESTRVVDGETIHIFGIHRSARAPSGGARSRGSGPKRGSGAVRFMQGRETDAHRGLRSQHRVGDQFGRDQF